MSALLVGLAAVILLFGRAPSHSNDFCDPDVAQMAYAADDLLGWSERKEGVTTRFDGIFTGLDISRAEVDEMIVAARIAAGWITEADLAVEAVDEDIEAEGEEGGEAPEEVEAVTEVVD